MKRAKSELLKRGWLPIFLPDTLVDVLDDDDDEQRVLAVAASSFFCRTMADFPDAEMVVVGLHMTVGMRSDVASWLDAGGPAPRNIADVIFNGEKEEVDDGGNH
ncbi:MAG TPA: hypothetical protein ENH89_23310 [Aurantimonas coralicida]|nr:hypothetical protein [Aurantimonas coralicida]